MRSKFFLLIGIPVVACSVAPAQEPLKGGWPACEAVPDAFVAHIHDVLADSIGMFTGTYPDASPLTCELLGGLQEAMKDDSVRYHFEHLSQRYWARDSHYNDVERYIKRHLDFHLSIAATAHFFEDIRIMGLKQLYNYRRHRPMVCATRDHYLQLEQQDKQAVRYLLRVLENTPIHITGSENATIHDVYISEITRTLDLFTGQSHPGPKDVRQQLSLPEADLRAAMADWRKWSER